MEETERESWGIGGESRMGRVWSLYPIAPEIGSINLHTASHAFNDTNLANKQWPTASALPTRQGC